MFLCHFSILVHEKCTEAETLVELHKSKKFQIFPSFLFQERRKEEEKRRKEEEEAKKRREEDLKRRRDEEVKRRREVVARVCKQSKVTSTTTSEEEESSGGRAGVSRSRKFLNLFASNSSPYSTTGV